MPTYTVVDDPDNPEPMQHPGITLVDHDGGPYNPATSIPDGTYVPKRPALYDTFTGKGTVALTVADSGQTWVKTNSGMAGSALSIINGKLTNTSSGVGTSAGYTEYVFAAPITRIGCEFTIGPGSTHVGEIALVTWATPINASYPTIPDTGFHLVVTDLLWILGAWSGNVFSEITRGNLITPLAMDDTTVYTCEATFSDSTATIVLPDKSIVQVTDARIASVPRLSANFEVFQLDASTDGKPKLVSVWADTATAPALDSSPTQQQLAERVRGAIAGAISSALATVADYPATADGDVSLTVPTSYTLVNAGLNRSITCPPSGKLCATFNGYLQAVSAASILWRCELSSTTGAGTGTKDAVVMIAGTSGTTGLQKSYCSVEYLWSGLTPGATYTVKWYHNSTASNAAILKLFRASGWWATTKVAPLAA